MVAGGTGDVLVAREDGIEEEGLAEGHEFLPLGWRRSDGDDAGVLEGCPQLLIQGAWLAGTGSVVAASRECDAGQENDTDSGDHGSMGSERGDFSPPL
jgi:hypothetical protein